MQIMQYPYFYARQKQLKKDMNDINSGKISTLTKHESNVRD
jgi:hypothetical protein